MLRDAWFIARKDLQYLLRRRETLIWVFVMPIVFFYMIGTITGGFGSPAQQQSIALQAAEEEGFLLDQLERRLAERDYAVRRPDAEELERYTRRLQVPAGFTESVLAGEPVKLRFDRRGEGIGTDYDAVRVNRAVYTLLADLVVSADMDGRPSAEAFERLNEMPRSLTLEVSAAGERKRIPNGFEQAVPGTMVMFTLLIMLTNGAVLLVIERNQGLLRRLAATPISRGSLVLGKWFGKLLLGMVQVAFAMLTGSILFDMDWGPNLPMILVTLLAYTGLTAALGILLGNLARSEGQAVGLGVLASNVLAALGGCWWPIEVTPAWMQAFSKFLPTGWAMDALHRLVSFGLPASSALPHLAALIAASLFAGWLSSRIFRFE